MQGTRPVRPRVCAAQVFVETQTSQRQGAPREARSLGGGAARACRERWAVGTLHNASRWRATNSVSQRIKSKVVYVYNLRRGVRRLVAAAQHILVSHPHYYSPLLTSLNRQWHPCEVGIIIANRNLRAISFVRLSSLRCGSRPSFIWCDPLLESERKDFCWPNTSDSPGLLIQLLNIIYRRLIHASDAPSKGQCCCV